MHLVLTVLALVGPGGPPAAAPPAIDIPFRTDATARLDPLFGDTTTLRAALDRFLALQAEMEGVHNAFSTAVHETLAALQPPPTGAGRSTAAAAAPDRGAGKHCPPGTAAPYARALSSGGRYLALGRQLQARYREIRRGDEAGDTIGLTPDYRWKARRAREQYAHLLGDYREMRVAFYDQLGAELRQAGCKPGGAGRPSLLAAPAPTTAATDAAPNPTELSAWALDPTDGGEPTALQRPTASRPAVEGRATTPDSPSAGNTATAIWIDVDNSLCDQPTRVEIDGQSMGELPRRNKTSVRTRAGPHELCVLPLSDARTCGQPGTLRKAYLHEDWSLTVHCTAVH